MRPERGSDLSDLIVSLLLHAWIPILAAGMVATAKKTGNAEGVATSVFVLAVAYLSGRFSGKRSERRRR